MNEPTDIIARMEAAQQRFNPFPSLLVSAENERRLQLEDHADWVQPGDPPALPGESELDYNERTGRYEEEDL